MTTAYISLLMKNTSNVFKYNDFHSELVNKCDCFVITSLLY